MERLKERLLITQKALSAFNEILKEPYSKIIRDAAIQRFEFTFEATWKLAQRYLILQEGLEMASPKSVIRASHQAKLLTESETEIMLAAADDRNLTPHTYNEELAEQIYHRLFKYQPIFMRWYDAIQGFCFSNG